MWYVRLYNNHWRTLNISRCRCWEILKFILVCILFSEFSRTLYIYNIIISYEDYRWFREVAAADPSFPNSYVTSKSTCIKLVDTSDADIASFSDSMTYSCFILYLIEPCRFIKHYGGWQIHVITFHQALISPIWLFLVLLLFGGVPCQKSTKYASSLLYSILLW